MLTHIGTQTIETERLIGTGTACVSVPILETKDRIRRT